MKAIEIATRIRKEFELIDVDKNGIIERIKFIEVVKKFFKKGMSPVENKRITEQYFDTYQGNEVKDLPLYMVDYRNFYQGILEIGQ
jgi:Ca2+-binding EF-hand superfamily protein